MNYLFVNDLSQLPRQHIYIVKHRRGAYFPPITLALNFVYTQLMELNVGCYRISFPSARRGINTPRSRSVVQVELYINYKKDTGNQPWHMIALMLHLPRYA